MPHMTLQQREILYNKILAELPNHKTFKALAKACNIGESTLWKYRREDPVFKEMWEERVQQIIEDGRQILIDNTENVAKALVEVAVEGKLPERLPGIKLFYDNVGHKSNNGHYKAVQINVDFGDD